LQPGPSFNGQQPVMFNPQVTPLQAPQAYFHPGGPQVPYLLVFEVILGFFRACHLNVKLFR